MATTVAKALRPGAASLKPLRKSLGLTSDRSGPEPEVTASLAQPHALM